MSTCPLDDMAVPLTHLQSEAEAVPLKLRANLVGLKTKNTSEVNGMKRKTLDTNTG